MEFSKETIRNAKSYNATERDILFATLIAAGANRGEAYYVIYDHGGKRVNNLEECNIKAAELLRNKPGLKVYVQKVKHKKTIDSQTEDTDEEKKEVSEEEANQFYNKDFIIKQYVARYKNGGEKEKTEALKNISDLLRMKQEENREEKEMRNFYLPWVSHCRTCKIMQIFMQISNNKEKPTK